MNCFGTSKRNFSNEFENQYSLQFLNHEKCYWIEQITIKLVLLCHVNIQESSLEDNPKFNFLRIIWESKMSWRVHFFVFQKILKFKLFTLVTTMDLPPEYTRFIMNLRMYNNPSINLKTAIHILSCRKWYLKKA